MKKVMIFLLCMTLLFSLCACGSQPEQTVPADTTPAVVVQPTEQEEQPEITQPQQTEAVQDMVELVRQYIDKPIEELYEVIGQPQSSDYASSCLGDGEDGLLVYDGFVVYTYREGDSEVVYDVE